MKAFVLALTLVFCGPLAAANDVIFGRSSGLTTGPDGKVTPLSGTLQFEDAPDVTSKVASERVDMVNVKCGGDVEFSNGGSCTMQQMAKDMAEHVDKYALQCFRAAARAAGLTEPKKIQITASGCFNDRTTAAGAVSNHARGRACDISAVKMDGGKEMQLKKPGSEAGLGREFYDGFRNCWKEVTACAGGGGGGEGATGSIGASGHQPPPANGSHDDHIHLSVPNCSR